MYILLIVIITLVFFIIPIVTALYYSLHIVVYPGPHGPVDSIRWEIFGESLQDYALLQTLGIDRSDPLLAPLKSFADFPKTVKWRSDARTKIFAQF